MNLNHNWLEARAAALEEAAVWHDSEAAGWQDQANMAYRLAQQGGDEAVVAEQRAQHETYTKHRIIHQQSAARLRALAVKPGSET